MKTSKVKESRANSLGASSDQKQGLQRWKQMLFKASALVISEEIDICPILSYIFQVFQCLSFLWFVLHPSLNIYPPDSPLLETTQSMLHLLNFYQLLNSNPSSARLVTFGLLAWFVLTAAVFVNSIWMTQKSTKKSQFIRLYKIICNVMYLFSLKYLSLQFIGLSINILYCDSSSPYEQGQKCYTSTHIGFCVIAGYLLIGILMQNTVSALIYFVRNPFFGGCLGYPNRYEVLSKTAIKIILPLFFAINNQLQLNYLYIPLLPILWGAFIFLRRISGVRSYNYRHFYVEYFCDGFLFCMSICSCLIYYLQKEPQTQAMNFTYSIVFSLLGAIILINVDKTMEEIFLQKGCQTKVQKQKMQKFFLGMINACLHVSQQESRKNFDLYTQVWRLNNRNTASAKLYRRLSNGKDKQWLKQQIYIFLLQLSNDYLEGYKNVTLELMRCQLLKFIGREYYSLREALQMRSKKMSFLDQFSLFIFLQGYKHLTEPDPSEYLVKMYSYHSKVTKLKALMVGCAQNNLEYWDQLCDESPSVAMLRSKATEYVDYSKELSTTFDQLLKISTRNVQTGFEYLRFLRHISADILEAIKVTQIINIQLSIVNRPSDFLLGDSVAVIVVDTFASNLGRVISSNNQTTNMLGYSKEKMIGKKLTRLMPEIYSSLHDSFILNYLQRDYCQLPSTHRVSQKPSEKLFKAEKKVTALTFQSYLVEVGLNLHLVVTTDNNLYIVGFLRQIEEDSGLIMVEAVSGNILGVNKSLCKLMKYTLTGKQVTQEEKKISYLLPQIDVNTLSKNQSQETILEIDTLTQKGQRQQFCLKVVATLKQLKYYENYKLLFIDLNDKISSTKKKLKQPLANFNKRSTILFNIEANQIDVDSLLSGKMADKKIPQLQHSMNKIKMSSSDNLDFEKDQGYKNEINLADRIEKVATQKQRNSFGCLIVVSYLFIVLSGILYFSYCLWQRYVFLNRAEEIYNITKIMVQLPYRQAKISLYTGQILAYRQQNKSVEHFSQVLTSLQQASSSLSFDYRNFIIQLSPEEKDKIFQNKKKYLFTIGRMINGKIKKLQINLTYEQGLIIFVNDAKLLAGQISKLNQKAPSQQIYLQTLLFSITDTADRVLAEASQEFIEIYTQEYQLLREQEILINVLMKVFICFLTACNFGFVILIGKVIAQKQTNIYEGLYSKLRPWDASQMTSKAQFFLSKHNEKPKKCRKSNLLRQNFTLQRFANLFNTKIKCSQIKSSIKIQQNDEQQQSLKTITEEHSNKSNLDGYIKIKYRLFNRSMTRFWFEVLCSGVIAVVIIAVSSIYQEKTGDKLGEDILALKRYGYVQKDLALMALYSQKIANDPTNMNYSSLSAATAAQFYQYSGMTSDELGSPIFKDVYGHVQTFQRQFSKHKSSDDPSSLTSQSILLKNSFLPACSKLTQMFNGRFTVSFLEKISADLFRQSFLAALVMLYVICLNVFLYRTFSRPLEDQRLQAVNMIRILSVWMINKCPKAVAYFAQ